MKITSALTLCLGFALVFLLGSPRQWPPRPGRWQFEELAWQRLSLEGLKGPEFEDDVSRFLAANDSDADTLRMADVLVVLDFTVSAWQRQQQAEFAAALVGNASATNSTWRLNFGFVLLKGNVSYELPLTDDYSMLQQQLLDPSFTTVPNLPPAPVPLRFARRTAEALRLCSEEIDRRGLFPPVSTALLVLTAGASDDAENVPGTIERAAELKVAQKAVIYAMALDEPGSRTPSRTLELEWMATDSSKEFNLVLPPAPTTTGTVTTATRTSATSTATSSTRTTSTATSKTVTGTTSTTQTSTTMTSTSMTSTSSTATTSTATTSTKTSSTQTTITATTTSSTSSSATKTTSTSSTITATTTSSTSSSATKTTSTSSTITATTTSSTSSSATRTTSTSSTATVTTSTSSTATATSTSSTSSSATVTTSTATTSTATTSTATSATTTSTETTSTTTSSTTNETENVTFTTTTAATTYQASNESNETATITSTTVTTTFLTATTTDDSRRLFGDSNAIDRELGSMIDDSRRLFGSNPVDIRDLGSLLGVELLQFFAELFVSLETTSSTPSVQVPSAGGLAAGIVVAIVLSTCCFIAVLMGIAFFVWHSMRSSGAVMDEFHPVEVVPPMPAPTPAPAPQPPQPPRDATQKALKEAIDMQDITRLRNLLSEILLKGWPEKKYTDLVLKALEVVATLKESAAEVLEQALSEGSLPGSALADARFAGVERELLSRAEGLRQRSGAGATAGTLG
mmetsp:Transcript_76524/g.155318  ORF Transcript_76524/g.155318 Transcript_76524/m.155318 type:complete len:746 (+) Transcript_76524:54-2291(+)